MAFFRLLPQKLKLLMKPQYLIQRFSSESANLNNTPINYPDVEVTTLDNGMRVANANSGELTATVGVYINGGSVSEKEQYHGVAHFLEHMAFKGTARRTHQDLKREIENMGAHLNAYTSCDVTVYSIKCRAKDVAQSVDILSDMVQNSRLDPEDIERERAVILMEKQEIRSHAEDFVFEILHKTAYKGTNLEHSVLGSSRNIYSIGRKQLLEFLKFNYTAPNIILCAAGGIEHNKLVELAQAGFGQLAKCNVAQPTAVSTIPFSAGILCAKCDILPLSHVVVGFEACNAASNDNLCLMLATALIGDWHRMRGTNSYMDLKLARSCMLENVGYSYKVLHSSFKDTGMWGIYFQCLPNECKDMLLQIQKELKRLSTTVSENEVAYAKRVVKTNFWLQEGTTAVCEEIGRHMLKYNRSIPLLEWEMRINDITLEDFQHVLHKYLYCKHPAVAVLGDVEHIPQYDEICSALCW